MKINLVHPKHGEKVAYHEAEAKNDMRDGWKLKPIGKTIEAEVVPIKKRGRPPKES